MRRLLLLAALVFATAAAPRQVEVRIEPAAGRLLTTENGRTTETVLEDREGLFLPSWLEAAEPFAYRVVLDAPLPWKALVPGRLVEETERDGRYRAVIESETPQESIPLLAGPWTLRERMHGGLRLRAWFDAGNAPEADAYLDLVAGYLDLYRDWIGEHPFGGFSVVSVRQPVGLGFPGLTAIGERVLRLPFIRHGSLGHEILHDWWGNGVYVDYAGGNWCEGLTTFMADHAFALRRGPEAGRDMRRQWLRDYAALPEDRDRPALSFVSKTHDASQVVGYHKVAFFFHMLRNHVGEAAFDKAIRAFWRDFRFRTAGWKDLRAAFEAAAGQDLKGFFDQWLARTGAPRLTLADVKADDGKVAFTLRQEGDPPHALDVPVLADGRRHVLRLEGPEKRFQLPGASRLEVDPDGDLFRRLDAAEMPPILRDVTLSGATVARVGADPAGRLAEALLDTRPRFGAPEPGRPLLLIGTRAEMSGFLEEAGLPAAPPQVEGKGSLRAWTGRRDGQPFLAVEGDDDKALVAAGRALPHYGRQGWLVMEGPKVVDKGAWPAGAGPLTWAAPGSPSSR